MKRNRQQKFRIKIIQELNLKKKQQKQLDRSMKKYNAMYKYMYSYINDYISFCKKAKIDPSIYKLLRALDEF